MRPSRPTRRRARRRPDPELAAPVVAADRQLEPQRQPELVRRRPRLVRGPDRAPRCDGDPGVLDEPALGQPVLRDEQRPMSGPHGHVPGERRDDLRGDVLELVRDDVAEVGQAERRPDVVVRRRSRRGRRQPRPDSRGPGRGSRRGSPWPARRSRASVRAGRHRGCRRRQAARSATGGPRAECTGRSVRYAVADADVCRSRRDPVRPRAPHRRDRAHGRRQDDDRPAAREAPRAPVARLGCRHRVHDGHDCARPAGSTGHRGDARARSGPAARRPGDHRSRTSSARRPASSTTRPAARR